MSPLAKFADELEALAGAIERYRFGGPERYVVDVDALRRKLRNLVDRMRRMGRDTTARIMLLGLILLVRPQGLSGKLA